MPTSEKKWHGRLAHGRMFACFDAVYMCIQHVYMCIQHVYQTRLHPRLYTCRHTQLGAGFVSIHYIVMASVVMAYIVMDTYR